MVLLEIDAGFTTAAIPVHGGHCAVPLSPKAIAPTVSGLPEVGTLHVSVGPVAKHFLTDPKLLWGRQLTGCQPAFERRLVDPDLLCDFEG